ncbi:DUF397 domain-containing protein [Actinomadura fibrosa]|uniref:DUF397 domain-containing protein n=1 Tax=Actinomadura fibrosa TaxID=111802 RepID=A0ABW2XH32_9ACTN|nr:DUF397 domain-containing protein [Actinomadura fibrosa]
MVDLTNAAWRKASCSTSNGGACVELAHVVWRKASRSTSNGGDCVELAQAAWHKAPQSTSNGGECVEVAEISDIIAIRDSKDPDGGVLLLTPEGFRGLTQNIRGDGG